MHASTTTSPAHGRWVFLALLAAVLLLALAQAVPARAAATYFDGGAVAADTATSLASDHTVYAFRFSNTTGGTYPIPDGTYCVKVRFTPNADGSPAGVDNRGFTWNGTMSAWIQEREDWTLFPTVTVTSGLITGGSAAGTSAWFYYKFGDTTKSGTYYLLVSLSSGASGTTRNANVIIPVTLLDQSASGAWVHDGAGTGQVNGKRAYVVDHAAPDDPIALQRTENNVCDDDGDGIVDNEQYGPVKAGGFHMAVPTGQALDAGLQSAIWPVSSTGFTITTADTDIALGASDQTAPTAPASPAVSPRDAGAVITWTAATDDTVVTAYRVYRWTDAPVGAGYTPMRVRVGTVTDTAFTDSSLANGTTYHYEVRAVDAATNVGPRSVTVDVTPDGTAPAPVTGLTAAAGDTHVQLGWTNPTDPDFAGVKVVRKVDSSPADPTDGVEVYDGSGTSYDNTGLTNGTHYFYAVFAYDTALNYATPATADATPAIETSLTLTATPAVVNWGQSWQLDGTLRTAADEAIPDAGVDLEQSIDGGATWTLAKALTATLGTSTYLDDVAAPQRKTQYRLVYAGDSAHAGSQSDVVTVTPRVKLGKPVVPSSVKKKTAFSVYGSLVPKQASGSKTVKIKCYLKKHGAWALTKTVTATNRNNGSASRYRVTFSLPSAGSWKLVASAAATAKFAATTSSAAFLKVK